MDGANHRTADTGIFSLGRKFEKSILNQLLAALASFGCVISLMSQRSSVRHNRTVCFRPEPDARCSQLTAGKQTFRAWQCNPRLRTLM